MKKRDIDCIIYDKYQEKYADPSKLTQCKIVFVCVPTPNTDKGGESGYDTSAIEDVLKLLNEINYDGIVVIKCTLIPGDSEKFAMNSKLRIIHNPEFLTARTAVFDFDNQKQIILGKTSTTTKDDLTTMEQFYKSYYPLAEISITNSGESEATKVFCNCFYASKVQIFTEFYLMCQRQGLEYNKITEMMIKNGWINPMHTIIPGPDGDVSFGGFCFPKDLSALTNYMNNEKMDSAVLTSVLEERNKMRNE